MMMLIMIMMVALGRVNENGSESKLCIRQNIMISELAGRLAGCWLLAGLQARRLLAGHLLAAGPTGLLAADWLAGCLAGQLAAGRLAG